MHPRFLRLFASLWAVFALAPLARAAALVGTLPGSVSVDNKGSANYSIPLSVPPGRGGLQPSLSLNYSSGSGNGTVGMGWSLSTGFPQSITRGRTILARDGETRGVNFDSNDKFYLDGKRLICVSGSYGAPSSSYRTEVDSFVTITTTGTGTDASTWNIVTFVVTDKSGTKFTFGKYSTSVDGYQSGGSETQSKAYAYALKRVEDPLGNFVSLSYINPQAGEYALSEVAYTGGVGIDPMAKVTLTYTDTRPDKNITYTGLRSFPLTKRLSQIDAFTTVSGVSTKTASYALAYDLTAGVANSKLLSVTPSFGLGGTLQEAPAMTVQWLSDGISFTAAPSINNSLYAPLVGDCQAGECLFGDVDGDGRDDMVTSSGTSIAVSLSTGTGFGSLSGWASYGGPILKLCDINGDGRKDIIYGIPPQSSCWTAAPGLYALVSDGTKFVSLNGATGTPVPFYAFNTTNTDFRDPTTGGIFFVTKEKTGITSRITVADFTGDGCDDILIHRYDGKVKLIKSLRTSFAAAVQYDIQGSALSAFANWELFSLKFLGYTVGNDFSVAAMPCDLNGDGLTDYVWTETIQNWVNAQSAFVQMNQVVSAVLAKPGGGFSTRTTIDSYTYTPSGVYPMAHRQNCFKIYPGDVNGDGLSDFLVIKPKSDAPIASPDVYDLLQSKLDFSFHLSRGGNGAPVFARVSLEPSLNADYKVPINGQQVVPISDNMEPIDFVNRYARDPGFMESDETKALWLVYAGLGSPTNATFEDINGDGRADYIWHMTRAGATGWWAMYSSGTSFSTPVSLPLNWTPTPGIDLLSTYFTIHSRQSADVNGDGLPDVVAMSGEYKFKPGADGIQFKSGGRGPLVTKIVNGLGRITDIAYKAAKDSSIYTPGAAVSYPIRELRASTPVVSDVWHDAGNGVAADRAHFSYQYSGNRLDLSGRGGLGFHSFVTLDLQTSVFKYQFLTQSFPMTGLAMREQTYRFWSDSGQKFRLISSHDNTVVFDAVSTYGTLYPFISKAVESRWEDASTAHFTLTPANPETVFTSTRPGGAHITISAESWFDGQTATQTTLPGVTGYQPGDTTTTGANVVVGTTTFSTFSGLPGRITRGNLTRLQTDFGDGFTETVTTTYKATTTNGIANLVDTVSTSVGSTGFGPESAPTKSFEYYADTSLVTKETVDAAGTAHDLVTEYDRATDARRRVSAIKVTGTGLLVTGAASQSLTTYQATAFDDLLDLPTTEKDAYGHTTTTVYSPVFGKPTSVTDTNGVVVATTYDPLGRPVSVTQTNGDTTLTTTSTYAWTDGAAGAWNAVQSVAPPSGAGGLTLSCVYAMRSATTVQPTVTSYYDRLGRVLRVVKEGFGTTTATTDNAYNNLGQTVGTSLPSADATRLWTRTLYDALGRVTKVTAPNGTVTATTYNGRATTVSVDAASLGGVDPAAQSNSTVVDAKGRTVAVWNANNVPTFTDTKGATSTAASLQFSLDGFGRMRTTTLKDQTQTITATYDPLGRQTSLNDPDKGNWLYENSPLGYVLKQTDAVGNITASTFDRLGRPLTRLTTEVGGATESAAWYYFEAAATGAPQSVVPTTANGGWVGSLQRETVTTSGNPGFGDYMVEKSYTYDAKGRVRIQLHHIDDEPGANPGHWFYAVNGYDIYNRPTTRDYFWRPYRDENPVGGSPLWHSYRIATAYDTRSYVTGVSSPSDNRTWWEAGTNGYDHFDRPVLFRKGAGHWTQRGYRAEDGVLTSIKTGPTVGATGIQNLSFNYDGLGNLTSRTGSGGTETFTYDELNRLKTSAEGAISYLDNGNIKNKGAVGGVTTADYTYNSSKPHAVATAFGYTHGYDSNGNLVSRSKAGESWTLKYAGFDKPRWMAKVGSVTRGSEFLYDPNRSRAVQLEFDAMSAASAPSHYTRKRIYAHGSAMEMNYENKVASGVPTWTFKNLRIYIPGPDGVIGTQEFELGGTGAPAKGLVYHQDHLGSIVSITNYGSTVTATYANDASGKVGRFSENAWGQRRDPLDWSGPPVTTDDGGADSLSPRGFTGHEMLDDIGLVHMNGRIYDPLLGRFLSADILIQKPGSLQSYNRYSYVQNNPLTLTDPSGFADDSSSDDNEKTGLAWLISVLAPDTNSLPQSTRSAPEAGSIEAEINDRVRAGFDKGVQVIEAEAKIVDAATGLIPGAQLGKDLAQLATGKDAIGRDVSRSDTTVRLAVGAAVQAGAKPVAELAGKLVGKIAGALSKEGETAVRIEGAAAKSGVKDEVKTVSADAKTFDQARTEAFEKAGMTDPTKVEFTKVDPKTGTVVEFKGPNGAKVSYDAPHASPGPAHDQPHVGWQTGGKRSSGGTERGNIPYTGKQHPSRSPKKGEGVINNDE